MEGNASLTGGVAKDGGRWTFGRVFGAGVAVLFLWVGGDGLWGGYWWFEKLERWRVERPFEGLIDVSEPGRFVFEAKQTGQNCCRERVNLVVPAEALGGGTEEEVLEGLRAKLEFADADGKVVFEMECEGMIGPPGGMDGEVPLFDFRPVDNGGYQVTMVVVKGAPTLKGVAQRVEGRYLLCGVEMIAGYMLVGMGGGIFLIGGIVGGMVWARVRRAARKLAEG